MLAESFEHALELAEARVLAGVHDDEFARHLGAKKAHMFAAPARKELVHMYTIEKKPEPQNKGKGKDGKPVQKANAGVTLAAMMRYSGYKPVSKKGSPRMVYSRDENSKYHEIHVDIDKKGEPRAIYHKERFK